MKETILGVTVNTQGTEQLIRDMWQRFETKEKALVVAINPEKLMKAKDNPELKMLLNNAEYQIPDGIGVILASKLNKGVIKERVTGIDTMDRILKEAAATKKSVFLYGAKPGVAEQAAAKILEKYPDLQIAGVQHGYEKDNEKVVSQINAAKADILFVAMGSPAQENWINANRDRLHPILYQGVGGSFDVYAGNIKRAPEFFLKTNLEWFYRLLLEPKRITRQLALPMFLLETLKHKR